MTGNVCDLDLLTSGSCLAWSSATAVDAPDGCRRGWHLWLPSPVWQDVVSVGAHPTPTPTPTPTPKKRKKKRKKLVLRTWGMMVLRGCRGVVFGLLGTVKFY